jgi:hypothetical protein
MTWSRGSPDLRLFDLKGCFRWFFFDASVMCQWPKIMEFWDMDDRRENRHRSGQGISKNSIFRKKKFYSKFFLYEESYNILFGYCCCFNFHHFFPPVLFIILGTFYNFCLYNYFCFFRCIFLINFNVILNVFTVIVFFCWFLCPSTSEWKMNKQEKQIDQMKHLINWRKWRDKFFYNYSYSLIFSSTFRMLVPCDQIKKKKQSSRKWWFEPIKASELYNLGYSIFF